MTVSQPRLSRFSWILVCVPTLEELVILDDSCVCDNNIDAAVGRMGKCSFEDLNLIIPVCDIALYKEHAVNKMKVSKPKSGANRSVAYSLGFWSSDLGFVQIRVDYKRAKSCEFLQNF